VGHRARHFQGKAAGYCCLATATLPLLACDSQLGLLACYPRVGTAGMPAFHQGGLALFRPLARSADILAISFGCPPISLQGPLQGHKVPIRWAAFSADGSQLVTASPDRTVLLWDVPSLSLIRTVPGGVQFSSVVCCSCFDSMLLWDVPSLSLTRTVPGWGQLGDVHVD